MLFQGKLHCISCIVTCCSDVVLVLFQGKLQLSDTGKHLQATEDYLQQHSLQETQLAALTKRVQRLNRRSHGNSQDIHHPDNKLVELNQELEK